MYISDLLEASRVELNAQVATKEEALDKLAELLHKSGAVTDKEAFLADIHAREALGTTGISEGVAIPHAKSDAVAKPAISAITVPGGVDFQARDGKNSRILFMIAAPKSEANLHIEMLGHISLILIEEKNREKLLGAASTSRFLSYIDRMEAKKFTGLD